MSDAELQQAYRAYLAHDLPTAIALCEGVLSRERKHAGALDLLGQLAFLTGKHEESLEHHKRAVQAGPKLPQVRTNYGRALAREGRHREAIAQYEKALKLDPTHAGAVAGMADSYVRQDKYDRARRLLARHAGRGPLDPAVAATYVSVLVHEGELDAAIEVGRGVLDAGPEPSESVRTLLFETARAYERSGEHVQAFDTARRANETLSSGFDMQDMVDKIDQPIATFTGPRPAAAPTDESPIFVFGMPRLGTTLTERILDAHPGAHGIGESDGIPQVVRTLQEWPDGDYPQCTDRLPDADIDDLRRLYLDELTPSTPTGLRKVDKNLGNHLHLGLITRLFPGASLVYCRRDPLDTCVSCYFEPLVPAMHPYASDLGHLGAYHRLHDRLMRHWAAVMPDRLIEIRYEDLVADQESVTRRLLDACRLPWDDRCLQFHETKRDAGTLSYDQVRRPVYATSIGRAERFGELLDPLRAALGE
jgi:Tfp pilus assembly protein PilF